MTSTVTPALFAVLVATGAAFTGCGGHDCLALPCALPVAIVVNVTGASGASVDGVNVAVSGATAATISCTATCRVPGTSGTYNLDVTAPGYAPMRRTLTVQGTNPPCGCPTVVTETVAIALVAVPNPEAWRKP